jgi:hypothetical protein
MKKILQVLNAIQPLKHVEMFTGGDAVQRLKVSESAVISFLLSPFSFLAGSEGALEIRIYADAVGGPNAFADVDANESVHQ